MSKTTLENWRVEKCQLIPALRPIYKQNKKRYHHPNLRKGVIFL